jgi:hypothetical protein
MKDSAIYLLYPEVKQIAFGVCYDSQKNVVTVNDDLILNKIAELTAAEPMRLLRVERDRRIALTDWRFRSDLTPPQAWIDYCQALRDLPANSTPTLDENGNLTGITWPQPPTD